MIDMDGAPDLTQTIRCHCLAARKRARALTRRYEAKLRRHGLRATQFSILASLTIRGPRKMGDLAERLGLERSTLTRSAALLEAKGWVRSERSGDGRERLLNVTEEGRAKVEAAFPDWKSVQDSIET
jgi:DNA-binding MarR family transcriptional regulator